MNIGKRLALFVVGWYVSVIWGYVDIFGVWFLLCLWHRCLNYDSFYKDILLVLFLELFMPNSLGLYSSILLTLFLLVKIIDALWKGEGLQKTIFKSLVSVILFLLLKQAGFWVLYRDVAMLQDLRVFVSAFGKILLLAAIAWFFFKAQKRTNRVMI